MREISPGDRIAELPALRQTRYNKSSNCFSVRVIITYQSAAKPLGYVIVRFFCNALAASRKVPARPSRQVAARVFLLQVLVVRVSSRLHRLSARCLLAFVIFHFRFQLSDFRLRRLQLALPLFQKLADMNYFRVRRFGCCDFLRLVLLAGDNLRNASVDLRLILRLAVFVHDFNRTIPREIVSRSISIIFASAFSIGIITSVLLIAGGGNLPPLESRHHFVEYLFDTVSAFGTVGLSMGVTPKLNDLQKYALILMMFVGRVGPLTLAFSLSRDTGGKTLTYAEEGVMVG